MQGTCVRASERACRILREDIIEWRLSPGTVLAEVEQSGRLGVSSTPVREALDRLTAEGLTTAAGGRGVVVTDVLLQDIDELFERRERLEGKAAGLAAGDVPRLNAAAAEHPAIAAGNPRLAEAATTLHLHRSLSHVKATHTPH